MLKKEIEANCLRVIPIIKTVILRKARLA